MMTLYVLIGITVIFIVSLYIQAIREHKKDTHIVRKLMGYFFLGMTVMCLVSAIILFSADRSYADVEDTTNYDTTHPEIQAYLLDNNAVRVFNTLDEYEVLRSERYIQSVLCSNQ